MRNGSQSRIILWPARHKRGWLLADPYQVAIVMWDGNVEDVFWGDRKKMRDGRGPFYLASTAMFEVEFKLGDTAPSSDDGTALGQSFYTSEGHVVTGTIRLRLRVVREKAERLLQLREEDDKVTMWGIANAMKSDCAVAVVNVLGKCHANDLRANLQDVRDSLREDLAAPASRLGLLCEEVYPNLKVSSQEDSPPPPKPPKAPPSSPGSSPPPSQDGVSVFQNDEAHYVQWLQPRRGYVLNANSDRRTTSDMRLHRADCWTLDPKRYRTLTVSWYKVCSTDEAAIQRWVASKYNNFLPIPCGICRP